jgi:hypothetical protein
MLPEAATAAIDFVAVRFNNPSCNIDTFAEWDLYAMEEA